MTVTLGVLKKARVQDLDVVSDAYLAAGTRPLP